jgi:hypothetical protein
MAICPLLEGAECKGSDCQWYDDTHSDCAVKVLAGDIGALDALVYNTAAINKTLDQLVLATSAADR